MAIKNSVFNDFLSTFLDSIGIFDCRLPGVTLRKGKATTEGILPSLHTLYILVNAIGLEFF